MRGVSVKAVRLTRLGSLVLFAGASLLTAGVLLNVPSLVDPGLLLLMLVVSSRILSVFIAGMAAKSLEVERLVEGETIEGKPVTVRLMLSNKSRVLAFRALVVDGPPRDLEVLDEPKTEALLLPGSKASLTYRVVPRVGLRCFGETSVAVMDPLGLSSWLIRLRAVGHDCIPGRPVSAPPQLPSYDTIAAVKPLAFLPEGGQAGGGTEFESIREFQPGDELRLVDWKATARLAKLMVKEFKGRAVGSAVVLLVLEGPDFEGDYYKTFFERASRTVISLIEEMVRRVSVILAIVAPGQEIVVEVRHAGALSEAVDAIASVRPSSGAVSRDLVAKIVSDLAGRHSASSIVIVANDSIMGELEKLLRDVSGLAGVDRI